MAGVDLNAFDVKSAEYNLYLGYESTPKMAAATTPRKRINNSEEGRNSIMKSIKTKMIFSVSMLFVATFLGRTPLVGQDTKTVQAPADSAYAAIGTGSIEPSASTGVIAEPQLRIGPGDLIDMKVFGIQELGQEVRVTDQGDASINLIGSMHLAGQTTVEAQEMIARKFQEGNFVLNPHVSVMIREYGTQGVAVLGEVKNPGVYQVLGKRTLLDLLSLAGGTTAYADSRATIKRHAGSMLAVPVTRDARNSFMADVYYSRVTR